LVTIRAITHVPERANISNEEVAAEGMDGAGV
jgi:hypothetical protein